MNYPKCVHTELEQSFCTNIEIKNTVSQSKTIQQWATGQK